MRVPGSLLGAAGSSRDVLATLTRIVPLAMFLVTIVLAACEGDAGGY